VRNRFDTSSDGRNSKPSAFLIKHKELDLRIRLLSSELLLLHEETIADRVAELKKSFIAEGVVKDPVIVDASSHVVLDGMHRVAALRDLHCICVPVCEVDYEDPSIRVGVWYRTLSGRVDLSELENALLSSGIKIVKVPVDIATVTENSSLAVLSANGECLRMDGTGWQAFEVLKVGERCVRGLGFSVRFETECDALGRLASRKADAIITLPKIDKALVREAGLSGRLLPHKVTRHIIPARPLSVNVPLKMLTAGDTTLTEANEEFVSSLRKRGMTQRPSRAVIESRRYEEETFIFQ